MEWFEDDELKKQWEEVEKVEERLKQKKAGGDVWQVEAFQNLPELVASQRMKEKKKE